jgi:ABC-2 type transport system ATP-binding protein
LSCALIHKPSVLFLDEPTTGVDAVSRKEFWELLRNLQKQNITIVVSTPYMDEASLCDRVALIQQGRILDIDSPEGITKKFGYPLWSFQSEKMYDLMQDLRSLDAVKSCYPFGQVHHVVLKNGVEVKQVEQSLKNHPRLTIHQINPTIEDCFMDLMTSTNTKAEAKINV